MMIGNLMLWPKIPKFGDLGSMLEKQKLVKKFQISQILKNLGCFAIFGGRFRSSQLVLASSGF